MREQQQSKLEKHGEGKYHEKAKERLAEILRGEGWNVLVDAILDVTRIWISIADEKRYYHEFDVLGWKKHSNGLISEFIVEIDGSSHEKKKQKNRDKTAEEYAAFFLPDVKFKRIDISLLLNPNIADRNILELLK